MLETTLSSCYVPGTNRKGDVPGANWLYLLPSLRGRHAVCLGLPPASTLQAVAQRAGQVVVACRKQRPLERAARVIEEFGLRNVQLVLVTGHDALPLSDGQADLVLLAERTAVRQLTRNARLQREIQRILSSQGAVYVEAGRGHDRWQERLDVDLGGKVLLWITPTGFTEMTTAVPARDRRTIDYFLGQGLDCPTIYKPPAVKAERFVNRHRWLRPLTARHAALLGPIAATLDSGPPDYLLTIARRAGVDLANYRWGMSARGRFRSRKVNFFLFADEDATPAYVVKLTRDPRLNRRLENEYHALRRLAKSPIGSTAVFPRAAFFGYHDNLAVLGQTAVEGKPFESQTTAQPDCPYAKVVIEQLTRMSVMSAQYEAADPAKIGAALETLLSRFDRIYRPGPAEQTALRDAVATIGQFPGPIPLVFQHGDPGAWNVLITPDGQPALLDWEAAEPEGMPLWDLFYFLRSYTVLAANSVGISDKTKAFDQLFLDESSLSRLLVDSVGGYCRKLELSPELIGPLLLTCWMHRALKEATRLSTDELSTGHYYRLLRLCIDRYDSSALNRRLMNSSTQARPCPSPDAATAGYLQEL